FAMFVAALSFVARYGHNVPYYDHWSLVPVLSGEQPVDLQWLWDPRNGHRIAIPKLLLVSLQQLTDWDSRTGMYASVILLGVASGALVRAAGVRRGYTSFADVTIPLLLL